MKLLYPLSLIYSFVYKLDKKFSISKKLFKPVVSVGGITWGGSGKTPVVIELLKIFVKNKKNPTVLTRGYFRKTKIPIVLKNGANGVNVFDSGDEALLIAKSVKESVIIVGADRYENALNFANKINTDVYILDDGFQHWNIERDIDIVCINAYNPFGNGLLIPAGNLRENLNALKRSSIIIITNSDMIGINELFKLKKKIIDISLNNNIFMVYNGEFTYKSVDLDYNFDIELLKKNDVYSLSAIGFVDGFIYSIKKSGIKIKDSITFRDHNYYDNNLMKKLVKKYKNSYFIVTMKDSVKLNNIDIDIKQKIAVLVVKLKFIENNKKTWEKKILNSLLFL
jgi:tetraacyldisaccharide 4'-kinase